VPAKYNMEDLPTPNNKEVRFVEQPERIVAAIRFSGFANDEKIARYREQLKVVLNQNGLSYDGEFSFLGYNSPFDLINRRNEVIVSIDWKG
ncbi:heme-binding protein, partial [Crocinitomicaceae bacterium]|nr:heme-binding protein [Crocinitomicaceae bacterium]